MQAEPNLHQGSFKLKSKTVKWGEHDSLSLPILKNQVVYTCVIDRLGRPSAIPGANEGQKCIVILLEEVKEG